eukprot:gene2826-3511_t
MRSFIETIGCSETDPTFHLFFDSHSNLFDFGENVVRQGQARGGFSVIKVKNVFLSSLSWRSMGGLQNLFFADGSATIYGPVGLSRFASIFRSMLGFREQKFFNRFKFVELSFTKSHEIKDDHSTIVFSPVYKDLAQMSNPIFSFIIKIDETRGKFNPEAAFELGVERGPLFRKLSQGSPVPNQDGVLIHPHQVLGPNIAGPHLSIIHCPTVEYIDSILESSDFAPYFEGGESREFLTTVFHHTPHDVFKSEKYGYLLNRFGSNVKHLVLNNENCEISTSLARSEQLVNTFMRIIPIMSPKNMAANTPIPIHKHESLPGSIRENILAVDQLTRVGIHPATDNGKITFTRTTSTPPIDPEDTELQYLDIEKTPQGRQVVADIQSVIKDIESMPNKLEYPKILFTGTGSAVSNTFRNVTGNLISPKPGKYFLLDAGEGTYLQMRRFFGLEKLNSIIKNLDFIWISHIHADHHLGIPKLIEIRQNIEKNEGIKLNPLVIVGNRELLSWLNNLKNLIPLKYKGVQIGDNDPEMNQVLENLDIKKVLNVPVVHCPDAYGIVLTFKNGYKLTFSGDTRPCGDLVLAGKDSDLLIHEATFNDDMSGDAMFKKHSTVGEALEVGMKMNAKFTLLTHFSQRYPVSNLSQNKSIDPKKAGISFDLIQASPYQFPILTQLANFFLQQEYTKNMEKSKLIAINESQKIEANKDSRLPNLIENLNSLKSQKRPIPTLIPKTPNIKFKIGPERVVLDKRPNVKLNNNGTVKHEREPQTKNKKIEQREKLSEKINKTTRKVVSFNQQYNEEENDLVFDKRENPSSKSKTKPFQLVDNNGQGFIDRRYSTIREKKIKEVGLKKKML